MTVPANRWKIGLFVVFGALVILMGLTWLGMARMKRSTHEAFVYFDEPALDADAVRAALIALAQKARAVSP